MMTLRAPRAGPVDVLSYIVSAPAGARAARENEADTTRRRLYMRFDCGSLVILFDSAVIISRMCVRILPFYITRATCTGGTHGQHSHRSQTEEGGITSGEVISWV